MHRAKASEVLTIMSGGDAIAPTVVNVTSAKANGVYSVGEVIAITVQFSEIVTVTGTPQLELETGTVDQTIDYASGSGSNTLTFNYTVAAADVSNDLDYKANNSLTLNGGSITDAAGNDATLTLPEPGETGSLGANKAIIIYTGIIADYPMNEASGTTAIDASGKSGNGTYEGVTLNQVVDDGTHKFTCPYFSGNNCWMQFYSANFVAYMNMDKFSVAGWLRVEDASVWTDGAFHDWVVINVDGVNQFFLRKQSANGKLYSTRTAQSEVHQIEIASMSTTDWFHIVIAGSVASDTFNVYLNGVFHSEFFQYSGHELWTGVIPSNTCLTGASIANVAIATHEWKGWQARLKFYNYVLSQAEITALAAETEA